MTPILPIVFHTGSRPWATNRPLAELIGGPEEFRPFAPRWQPLFWDLAEQDPHRLLAAAGAWIQSLTVVRTEQAERAEFEAVLARVLPRLVELRRREEIRGHDLLWFVLSWALRRRPPEERERLLPGRGRPRRARPRRSLGRGLRALFSAGGVCWRWKASRSPTTPSSSSASIPFSIADARGYRIAFR